MVMHQLTSPESAGTCFLLTLLHTGGAGLAGVCAVVVVGGAELASDK